MIILLQWSTKSFQNVNKMKVQKFEIQLHAPQPVYYAGQTVSGMVVLELAGELEFRAIELGLHGKANVSVYFSIVVPRRLVCLIRLSRPRIDIVLQNWINSINFHQVAWSERHGSGKNRRTVHYRNSETYLDLKIFLVGDGKDKTKLPAGLHSFPFAITLPPNLPSTFMGAHGEHFLFVISKNVLIFSWLIHTISTANLA